MSRQIQVLLVEDSEDDALLLLRELKRGGYQVEYERVDTPEAMSAALDSRKWDIIIADYVMPHFSGLSALKLLRKKEIDLPFILVSGKIEEDIAVGSMKAGAQDFINKNNLTRLVPAIERELAEAQVRLKRKLAEEALRKSEEKYRMIVETTHEGIWVLDKSGKTSYANSRMAQMLGCKVEEMLGRHLFDFMDAQARIDAQIYLERRQEGITETHDFRFSRKDGTDLWTMAIVNPIIDEKGQYQGALGMITDISQRKQAEKALRQSEMELLESQRLSQVGSWQWMIASDTFFFSEGLNRIIGRDPALPPLNFKKNLEMYTGQSRVRLEAAVADAIKNGTPYELDMELLHPDGSHRFMIARGEAIRNETGQVEMLRGTLQDITERKKREEEIRSLNAELEKRVRERTVELEKKNVELERFNKVFVGRELRMIELKKQIEKLEKELEEIEKSCGQKEEKIGGTA